MRSSLVESKLPVLITFAVVAVRNVKTYLGKVVKVGTDDKPTNNIELMLRWNIS